jgi:hypothetical protein
MNDCQVSFFALQKPINITRKRDCRKEKILADCRVGELSKAQCKHINFAAKNFCPYRITAVLVEYIRNKYYSKAS